MEITNAALALEQVENELINLAAFQASDVLDISTVDDFEQALQTFSDSYDGTPPLGINDINDLIQNLRDSYATLENEAIEAAATVADVNESFTFAGQSLSSAVGGLSDDVDELSAYLEEAGEDEILVRKSCNVSAVQRGFFFRKRAFSIQR